MKLEFSNSRVMGTWDLTTMVSKGWMKMVPALSPVAMVVEEEEDRVEEEENSVNIASAGGWSAIRGGWISGGE